MHLKIISEYFEFYISVFYIVYKSRCIIVYMYYYIVIWLLTIATNMNVHIGSMWYRESELQKQFFAEYREQIQSFV